MKWFYALFSVYILSLSLLTCVDGQFEPNLENQQVILAADAHAEHDHSNTKDNCSPLCSCHCCHIHVSFTSLAQNLSPFQTISTYPSSQKDFNSLNPFELFVPPKA